MLEGARKPARPFIGLETPPVLSARFTSHEENVAGLHHSAMQKGPRISFLLHPSALGRRHYHSCVGITHSISWNKQFPMTSRLCGRVCVRPVNTRVCIFRGFLCQVGSMSHFIQTGPIIKSVVESVGCTWGPVLVLHVCRLSVAPPLGFFISTKRGHASIFLSF